MGEVDTSFISYVFVNVGDVAYGFYSYRYGSSSTPITKIAKIDNNNIDIYDVKTFNGGALGIVNSCIIYYIPELEQFFIKTYYGYAGHILHTIDKSGIDNGDPISTNSTINDENIAILGYINNQYYAISKRSTSPVSIRIWYGNSIGDMVNTDISSNNNGGDYVISKSFYQKLSFIKDNKIYIFVTNTGGTVNINSDNYKVLGVIVISSPSSITQYNINLKCSDISDVVSQMFNDTITVSSTSYYYGLYLESKYYLIGAFCITASSPYGSNLYVVYRIPLFDTEYQSLPNEVITISNQHIIPTIAFTNQFTNAYSDSYPQLGERYYDKILMFNSNVLANNWLYIDMYQGYYYITILNENVLTRQSYQDKWNVNKYAPLYRFNVNNCLTEYLPDILYYPVEMGSTPASNARLYNIQIILNNHLYYIYKRNGTFIASTKMLLVPPYSTPMIRSGKSYIKAKT